MSSHTIKEENTLGGSLALGKDPGLEDSSSDARNGPSVKVSRILMSEPAL